MDRYSETRKRHLPSASGTHPALSTLWLLSGLALVALGLGCSQADPQPSETVLEIEEGTLAIGQAIEIELDGAGVHLYSLQSAPGQAQRLIVDARGNDVSTRITTQRGEVIRETPGNGYSWGVEIVSFQVPGDITLPNQTLTLRLEVLDAAGSDTVLVELRESSKRLGAVEELITAEELLGTARRGRGQTRDADIAAEQQAIDSAGTFANASDPLGEAIAALEVVSICIDGQDLPCLSKWSSRGLELSEALKEQRLIDQALPTRGLAKIFERKPAEGRNLLDRSVAREEMTTTVRHQARNQIFLSFAHQLATTNQDRSSEDRTASIRLRKTAGERALELFEQAGDLLGAAEARISLLGYTLQEGDYFKSLEHAQKVEEVLERLPDTPRGRLEIYNSLGVHFRSMGDHQRALEYYARGAEIIDRTGFKRVELLSNFGRLNLILGDIDAAIELHERALPDAPSKAATDLGRCYLRLGHREKAIASFRSAIDKSGTSDKELAWGLDGLATAQLELGHYEEAIETLKRSLEVHRGMQTPLSEAYTLRTLAEAYWREGKSDEAREFAHEARRIFSGLGDDFVVARADELIGAIEQSQGNLQTALDSFERAAATYEEYRSELEDVDRRANFFASRQDIYVGFLDLLAELDEKQPEAGYAERAFEVSERARARSLVDMLRSSRWDPSIEESSELFTELKSITTEVTWLRQQIETLVTQARPDPNKLEEFRLHIDTLQAERETLWNQIRDDYPRYAELKSPSPVSLERIQEHLTPQAALLQFAVGEEQSYLFVVTDDDLQLFTLGARRSSIENLSNRFNRKILERRSNEQGFASTATKLYANLLEPAAEVLASRSEWIIVPDGPLYTLPFEALMAEEEPGKPTFLLEQASIHYAPSATTLVTLKGTGGARDRSAAFTAFADSLPESRPLRGAKAEVARIMALIPSEQQEAEQQERIFIGAAATENAVKTSAAVRTAKWLHFATHGEFDPKRPESSGIVLGASSPGEESLLTSEEILELNLSADLVVLSGCQTGLGKQLRGEGIVGLTRAFMYAGAQSLAVSLWKVEDRSTAELMVHFYGAMLNGESRADALRAAKLELIRSEEEWSHPFFWAPFVLVGPS